MASTSFHGDAQRIWERTHCVTLDHYRNESVDFYFPILDELEAKDEPAIFTAKNPYKPNKNESIFKSLWPEEIGATPVNAFVRRPHVEKMAMEVIESENPDKPSVLLDVREVFELHYKWNKYMRGISPYFAMKANNHPVFLTLLYSLGGISFDCASAER